MKIVAIDIGGTEIKGSLMSPKVIKSYHALTDLSLGKETILASLYCVIDELIDPSVKAISIVTAGTIDTENTTIIGNMGTMKGWLNFNLGTTLKKKYAVPVFVDNDANGAMIGEMQKFRKKNIQNAVMITLGTGVGTALYLGGQLYRGPFYNVEFGHMILYPQGRLCTCGRLGCVEQYISGTALTRAAQTQLDSTIRHGSELFSYLDKKHPVALKLWQLYVEDLALFLQNVNQVIDPELFIIGGGIIKNKEILLPALKKAVLHYDMHKPILAAQYGNTAGIQGAYYYAVERMHLNG
jgi:glucokinase